MICQKCKNYFSMWIVIDGKGRNLSNRRFCLDCSPFGKHNTSDLTHYELPENQEEKVCPKCKIKKYKSEFSRRRKNNHLSFYCKACISKASTERQRDIKQQAVDYKGGKCLICGYNKYIGAMHFHHIDPSQKDFTLSQFKGRSLKTTKSELDKCVLLCSRCHDELHGGLHQIEDYL